MPAPGSRRANGSCITLAEPQLHAMVESHLMAGARRSSARHRRSCEAGLWQRITDACLGLGDLQEVPCLLSDAVKARRTPARTGSAIRRASTE